MPRSTIILESKLLDINTEIEVLSVVEKLVIDIFGAYSWSIKADMTGFVSNIHITLEDVPFNSLKTFPKEFESRLEKTFKYQPSVKVMIKEFHTKMSPVSKSHEPSITSSTLYDDTPIHKLTEVQLDVYRYIFGEVETYRALSNLDGPDSTLSKFTTNLANYLKGE